MPKVEEPSVGDSPLVVDGQLEVGFMQKKHP